MDVVVTFDLLRVSEETSRDREVGSRPRPAQGLLGTRAEEGREAGPSAEPRAARGRGGREAEAAPGTPVLLACVCPDTQVRTVVARGL